MLKAVNERVIQIGYVTALSLIIAAILYFFASNWPGFDKWQKIGLSSGLMALFYAGAFLLSRFFKRRPFLSELFLFVGCISFGISVALLGQIYNSHADSFMLFVVWAVPAILFSFLTKYQPFYFLSYILIHLSIWFFLFPSSGFHTYEEYWYRGFFLGLAAANFALFAIIEKGLFRSKPLAFLSFLVFHFTMLHLTTGELFEVFSLVMSFVYLLIFVLWFLYYVKTNFHKGYTVLLGLSFTVFVIIKFIAFLIFVGSEFVFLFTMFLPVLIVGGAVFGISKWRASSKGKGNPVLKRIFIGVIALISSVIAAISISGTLFLVIGEVPYYVTAILAAAGFIVPAVLLKEWDPVIRYTMLLTGFFVGVPSVIFLNNVYSFLFIGVLGFVFWMYESQVIKYFTYLLAMVVLFSGLIEEAMDIEGTMLTMLMVNFILLAASFKGKAAIKKSLYLNSVFYSFLSFFALTFLFENSPAVYFTVNGFYFVLTTLVLFLALKWGKQELYWMSLLFWFAYVVYKYYDLLWSLLHKSMTFMIVGLLIFVIINRYDLKGKAEEGSISFVQKKRLSIVVILFLQFAVIGFQVGKSETLLANGELVKLELRPVDPRSLLQGDYVILRYTISDLNLKPEPAYNEKVKIGLVKNEQGIYEYSGEFLTENDTLEKASGRIWITGRHKGGGNIEYGIENYFVEEGTGLEVEQSADYANVKVSKSGDAIIVSLE